jgi:hypothetical protein
MTIIEILTPSTGSTADLLVFVGTTTIFRKQISSKRCKYYNLLISVWTLKWQNLGATQIPTVLSTEWLAPWNENQ